MGETKQYNIKITFDYNGQSYGEEKTYSEDSLFCANRKEIDELKLIGCLQPLLDEITNKRKKVVIQNLKVKYISNNNNDSILNREVFEVEHIPNSENCK